MGSCKTLRFEGYREGYRVHITYKSIKMKIQLIKRDGITWVKIIMAT